MAPEIKVNSKKAAGRKPASKDAKASKPTEVKAPVVDEVGEEEEEEEETKVPKGYIVAEEGKYVAKETCTHGIGLYKKGAIYHATDGELLPHHFEKA